MKDPERLRDQPELPDALHEALRELGARAPSSQTISRVQQVLGGLATPPVPPSGAATSWLGVGSYFATAAALGVLAVAAWQRLPYSPEQEAEQPILRGVPARELAAPQLEAAEEAAVQHRGSDASEPLKAQTPSFSGQSLAAAARGQNLATASIKPRRRSHASKLAAGGHAAPTEVAAPSLATTAATSVIHGTAAAASPTPQPEADSAPPSASAAPAVHAPVPEDEAALMFRAKKAARADPRAAWRMLELHRVHFPNGTLAEEREVLAIDLLRRMGREPEAKSRVARFLVRYPQSSYRSTIQR